MQVVSPDLIRGKKVLVRLDIDVPVENGKVGEILRLEAGIPTLEMCLQNAEFVTAMGHIGRPGGKEVPQLSVEPIYDWLAQRLGEDHFQTGKLKLLENLRFEPGEEAADLNYTKELASYGDFYINEAFASHHPAASTTVLPTLLPHAAGLHFAKEVETLARVRENPGRPFVAIIGGVKVEDKLPAVLAMAKIADEVLVGGKIAGELRGRTDLPGNVVLAVINDAGTDLTEETAQAWLPKIAQAKMVLWNGPLGRVEDPQNDKSRKIAQAIASCQGETILGGGDSIAYVNSLGLLGKFGFVSTGGGAMLKFLIDGTLPAVEALK